jgi:hypothetical protein
MSARVPFLALTVLGLLGGCEGPVNNQQGYMPVQPIAFSHAVHAGHYELDCQYCHTGAERSRHAGVPSSSICMNCHTQVKTDSPDIQKVAASVKEGKPLEWVRVHRLPDHAWFSHANHVTAGLKCQGCHGPVEQMVRVEQVEPMTMGWCLDCHRKTAEAQVSAPSPRILQPPTDCSACHR